MSTMITFLGGDETGDAGSVTWGKYKFELNKPVAVSDQHIIAKARTNQFFKVEGDEAGAVKLDPNAHVEPRRKPGPKSKDE
jgi:hypothetical protein